ncbi:MAG TPA: response regulator transcription factor [Polyangia bacterium]|nr:response regulator transcription factor [Polyangia bacterium]
MIAGGLGMRVLLADDHALVRAGIRSLLVAIPDVESVIEAGDGHQALALLLEQRPDVALIDIGMPGLNGLELAARVGREAPATRLVIVSMHGTPSHVAQALRAGVSGYVLKDAAADELPVLLRAVSRGETYLSPAISKQVVEGYLGRAPPPGLSEADGLSILTSRQREILQLVAEGKSTKEIAQLLDLSIKTVETHRGQIMDRLGIHDLAGLVRYAVRTGLVSSDR